MVEGACCYNSKGKRKTCPYDCAQSGARRRGELCKAMRSCT